MTYSEPEDGEELEGGNADESNDLRNLRRKAKKADQLERENAEGNAAKRELAFLKAGVDTSTPIGQLYMNGYDGELDAEAIKAGYEALGMSTPTASENDEAFEPDEAGSTQERQSLASGATGDTGETPPIPVRGMEGRAARAGRDALANGAPREDAIGAMFGTLAGAAAEGDRTVIVPFGGGSE